MSTTTEEAPTMSLMEQLLGQAEITDAIHGDVISTGAQIRIRVGDKPAIVPVDGQQTYALFRELGLTRLTVRNQNGMLVVSATLTSLGEEIGLINPETGERIPLPAYSSASFETWRTWVHPMNVEMMKADADAIKELTDYLDSLGFVQWYRKPRPGQEMPERTTETLYDKEVPGTSLVDRHAAAPRLRTVTIIPDHREDANWTKYTRKSDQKVIERAGFTSFPDTIMLNTRTVIEKFQLGADVEDRNDQQRDARNRMSMITGFDPETGYPTRPSWGYLSFEPGKLPEGMSTEDFAETVAGGKELNLFTVDTAPTTTSGDTPTLSAGQLADDEDPWEGMDETDQQDPADAES